ncbi:MAG TPA: hypothetical protein VFR86_15985 [Burkholderiaceae bacterium]|nr:hypothetical protein [Burkholderiaceae bacterium]
MSMQVHESMAVWDEHRWNEFESGLQGSLRNERRRLTAMQRLAEETRYAGARPVFWMSLAITVAIWMI